MKEILLVTIATWSPLAYFIQLFVQYDPTTNGSSLLGYPVLLSQLRDGAVAHC